MYQPALRPEQVKALYYLKLKLGRPMTELVREAVETYLNGVLPVSVRRANLINDCDHGATTRGVAPCSPSADAKPWAVA